MRWHGVEKTILDVTCGSRTIWFDKNNAHTLYCDRRKEAFNMEWKSTRNPSVRTCYVDPDVVCDFTKLPFPDESFRMVVFDPPTRKRQARNPGWSRNTEALTRTGAKCCMTDLQSACGCCSRTEC